MITVDPPLRGRFFNRDCREGMKEISPGSVDAIFTDPIYLAEYWEEAFTVLARGAMHVLRPGGWCITYQPQRHFDDILDIMRRPGLKFYWPVPVINQGKTAKVHDRNAVCLHKPLVIYQRPREDLTLDHPPKAFADVIRGLRQKNYHGWQQDIHDPISLLSRLCLPGDLILDPYAGTATTLLAAKAMGMRYLGFEIDPVTWKKGNERLSQTPLTLISFD